MTWQKRCSQPGLALFILESREHGLSTRSLARRKQEKLFSIDRQGFKASGKAGRRACTRL